MQRHRKTLLFNNYAISALSLDVSGTLKQLSRYWLALRQNKLFGSFINQSIYVEKMAFLKPGLAVGFVLHRLS